MADKTTIEWCDATWNPITGCTPCSPGCNHCYAAAMVRRFPHLHGLRTVHDPDEQILEAVPFNTLQFHEDRLEQPLHWRRPRRVFVCSMGDLFHPAIPESWLREVIKVMAECPQHTFLLLTKRPGKVGHFLTMDRGKVRPNCWLGVTVCNQTEATHKIPILLRTPAALRFVSVEPMLRPIVFHWRWLPLPCMDWEPSYEANGERCQRCACCRENARAASLDWVILGGENGPGARPLPMEAAERLTIYCRHKGVPVFFKGRGTYSMKRSDRDYQYLLGRQWHEFPEVHP